MTKIVAAVSQPFRINEVRVVFKILFIANLHKFGHELHKYDTVQDLFVLFAAKFVRIREIKVNISLSPHPV